MSQLVVIAYDTVDTATDARQAIARLAEQHAIELQDAVVVERREDGKVKLHQAVSPAGAGAAGGALWGGVIGLLFLAPLVGMALGAAVGGASGAAVDFGVNDQLMKDLGSQLENGGAALFVLFASATADKVLPELRQYGGAVLQTSLSDADEATLREALAGAV